MRKLLLASVFTLVPFVAFAEIPAGVAASGSLAGVQGSQATDSRAFAGNGLVISGAVAGNYTDMQTRGFAKAGDGKAITNTTAQQGQVGGAITGVYADPGHRGMTFGTANASQNSQALGGSAAIAVTVEQGQKGHGWRK